MAKNSLNYHDFIQKAMLIEPINSLINIRNLDDWHCLGLNLIKTQTGKITLQTKYTKIKDQIFCVVDIEANGSLSTGQIIEIGAIKMLDGEIIDKFNTLVFADDIPPDISKLTGIYPQDLISAPNLKETMEKFKLFLSDCVFVAHNVGFDYGFISASMEKIGFGMLLNRRICTIDLARKTIPSQRYGLETLKELLNIKATHHRALSDALCAALIFKESLSRLPNSVKSVEDLILFSKTGKMSSK